MLFKFAIPTFLLYAVIWIIGASHYIKTKEKVLRPIFFENFRGNNIFRIRTSNFATFHLVYRMDDLDFSNNEIEYIQEGTFDVFVNLRRLILVNNSIPFEHLFSFGNLSKLEILWLGNDTISEPVPVPLNSSDLGPVLKIRNYYPNLRKLGVFNVGAENISSENWKKVMPRLQEVFFSKNRGIDLQNFFDNCPFSVKIIRVTGCYLKSVVVPESHNYADLRFKDNDFRSLYLTDRLDSCQSEHQLCLGPMDNLTFLSLNNCNISELNIHYFNVDAVPNLKHFEMVDNNVLTINVLPTMTRSIPKLHASIFATIFGKFFSEQ